MCRMLRICPKKRIKDEILIPLSFEDLLELMDDEEFHWEIDGIKVHIKKQED